MSQEIANLDIGKNYTISVQLWSFNKASNWVDWWHYVLPDENEPVVNFDYDLKKVTIGWTGSYKDMTLVFWSTAFNSSGRQYSRLSSASGAVFELPLEDGTWYWYMWMPSVDPLFGYPKMSYLYLTPVSDLHAGGDASNSICDGDLVSQSSDDDVNSNTLIFGYDELFNQIRLGPTNTVSKSNMERLPAQFSKWIEVSIFKIKISARKKSY